MSAQVLHTLRQDIVSFFTKNKKFKDGKYHFYTATNSKQEAFQKKKQVEKIAYKQQKPSLSRRKRAEVYDSTRGIGGRYAVYIPISWYQKYPQLFKKAEND